MDAMGRSVFLLLLREVIAARLQASPSSPYDFNWTGQSFEDRWQDFRLAVPLSELQDQLDTSWDTGPRCWPSLEGPPESENLAILTHGFTACPGFWYPEVKALVAAGWRVMRPLLPGHGRKYSERATHVCSIREEDEDGESCAEYLSNPDACNWTADWNCPGEAPGRLGQATLTVGSFDCCCKKTACREGQDQTYEDDLSEFPQTVDAYLMFAEALGQLAEQWKHEHPDGKVVALGHSLGGLITAKFAMERPTVVDRILLKNPMLGLPHGYAKPLLHLGHKVRFSMTNFDPKCDELREQSTGGYCQIYLSNVIAMMDLAKAVLCHQWGLLGCSGKDKELAAETRSNFSLLKRFQIVTSYKDGAIDNSKVKALHDEVLRQRVTHAHLTHGSTATNGISLCHWPQEVGHGYANNHFNASERQHLQPYLEHTMVNFLLSGQNVPIVRVYSDYAMCIESPEQVSGLHLTVIPALPLWLPGQQHDFVLSHAGPNVSYVRTLFEGRVQRSFDYDSSTLGRWMYIDLLAPGVKGILVVVMRNKQGDDIAAMWAAQNPVQLSTVHEKRCILPTLTKLQASAPLFPQLQDLGAQREERPFFKRDPWCKDQLVAAFCQVLDCESRLKSEVSGSPQPRGNITVLNRMDCNVTFQAGSDEVVLQSFENASRAWGRSSLWSKPKAKMQWQSCRGEGSATVYAGQTLTVYVGRLSRTDSEGPERWPNLEE